MPAEDLHPTVGLSPKLRLPLLPLPRKDRRRYELYASKRSLSPQKPCLHKIYIPH